MITVVSCSHYPDDERIYHKEIKSLSERKLKINYFTLSDSGLVLSDDYINHINYRRSKYSINEYIKLIENKLRKLSTKVIHIHEPELFSLAITAKKLFGAKIIYDVHEDYPSMIHTFSRWYKYIKYLKEKYWILKERSFLSYADEIIIASPTIINSDFIAQGFNPILLENFPLKFFLKNINTNLKRKNSIIYHGNVGPERGIVELIKAMSIVIKKVPDASLSLFGGFRTSEYKNNVNEAIDSLGIRSCINLEDHILHGDIWKHLEKHMIGVIPFNDNLLTRINTPTKLFEFMAAGCQLVFPNLPAINRYDIKGATNFLAGDINGLANAIVYAINNIDQEDLRYNQEKIKSLYNWDDNSYKLIKLYNGLLS